MKDKLVYFTPRTIKKSDKTYWISWDSANKYQI